MLLYLSGPMSGYPEFNFPAFFEAATQLQQRGYQVVNPAQLNAIGDAWVDCIRRDLLALLDPRVKGLALLPGWMFSRGSQVERYVAYVLGLPVKSVEEWLADA